MCYLKAWGLIYLNSYADIDNAFFQKLRGDLTRYYNEMMFDGYC